MGGYNSENVKKDCNLKHFYFWGRILKHFLTLYNNKNVDVKIWNII